MQRKLLEERSPAVVRAVECMQEKGARVYDVCCRNGRYYDTHQIVVTARGEVFFPDHGMATVGALLAEMSLRKPSKFEVEQDRCFQVAAFLAYVNVSSRGSRTVREAWGDIEFKRTPTQEEQKVWPALTREWILGISALRNKRYISRNPQALTPVEKMTPFTHSARERIQPIINARTKFLNDKLSRVNAKLRKTLGLATW